VEAAQVINRQGRSKRKGGGESEKAQLGKAVFA
jgi:hypothetical protein